MVAGNKALGQQNVLQTHYARNGSAPVAYIDETYHVESDGRSRFYAMTAVVVLEHDRDPLRQDLDQLVPSGWWHATEAVREDAGRNQARGLLRALQMPDEICVIVDQVRLDNSDKDGLLARGAVLERLLTAVHTAEAGTHPAVPLVVIEESRDAKVNNFDRSVRKKLVQKSAIPSNTAFVAVSPGSEHLLWLPDVVCSAYRQKRIYHRADLFDEIEQLTQVIEIPG